MTSEIPGASAPEQKKPRTTVEDVQDLLTRTEQENVIPPTKEGEKTGVKKTAKVGLLTMELESPPSDKKDKALENGWKRALKADDTPKELAERAKQASFRLNDYMRTLQDETTPAGAGRASFKRDFVSKDTRQHDAAILKQIDEMFVNCQKDGLVTVYGDKLCNRVGYAAGRVRQLEEMLKRADITEDQKKYITRVKNFFQTVMDKDPTWNHFYQETHKKREWSPAMKEAAGAARFVALLAAGALAVIATLMDLKNKKLSLYTMAWIGIAAGIGGAFVGKDKVAASQLTFFAKSDWEKLNLNGKNGRLAIEMVYRAHKRKGKTDRAFQERYRKQQEGRPSPNEKPVTTQEYINWLAGESPTGAEDIAAKREIERIAGAGKLEFFVQKVMGVRDPSARNVFLDLVGESVNSKSVAEELRNKPKEAAPAVAPLPKTTPGK